MKEQQKVCAKLFKEGQNCSYAKVVEEVGKYPVITFQAENKNGSPDLSTIHNVKSRVDEKCYCVYCTHPSNSEDKFIGSVEPYFPCFAPTDCPVLKK